MKYKCMGGEELLADNEILCAIDEQMYLRIRSQSLDRAKLVRFCKFSHKSRDSRNREPDSHNLVLRGDVNTSLASEPSPKPSTNRFCFGTPVSGFIAARLFFSIADANSTSNFVYDLLWRKHVQDLVDQLAFLIPSFHAKIRDPLKTLSCVKHIRVFLIVKGIPKISWTEKKNVNIYRRWYKRKDWRKMKRNVISWFLKIKNETNI